MPILTNITRRFALSLGLAAAIGFSAPMPAAALATDEAERFLGGVLDDMRGLIQEDAGGEAGAAGWQ